MVRGLRDLFDRWIFGVVGLAVLPAAGAALWVPEPGSSVWIRALAGAVGAIAGIVVLAVLGVVFLAFKEWSRPWRRKRADRRLGQECVDCAKDVLRVCGFKTTGKKGTPGPLSELGEGGKASRRFEALSDLEVHQIGARYHRFCAARVYRCATDLCEGDHIDRGEREKLRTARLEAKHEPMDPAERVAAVIPLVDVAHTLGLTGIRLGGRVYRGSRGSWDVAP